MRNSEMKGSPILGLFDISGKGQGSFAGILRFDAREAELTILIAGDDFQREIAFPAPDERFEISGLTHEQETLTLVDCVWSSSSANSGDSASFKVTFKPNIVWTGPRILKDTMHFDALECGIDELHGLIGTKVLSNVHADEEKFLATGSFADASYERHNEAPHILHLPELGLKIQFQSSLVEYVSWANGIELSVRDFFVVENAVGASRDEFLSLKQDIESYLSFVSLRKVVAQSITLVKNFSTQERWRLLWQRGSACMNGVSSDCNPLVNCRSSEVEFLRGLSRWLQPTEGEKLARWLLHDIQDQTHVSPTRFVTACQIAELLGGEKTGAPYDKTKLKRSAKKAAKLLTHELESPAYEKRFYELIMSFNRASLRDMLNAFCDDLPQAVQSLYLPDRADFISSVLSLRNLFVHLKASQVSFKNAEALLAPVTFRLMALIVAHQSAALGFNLETYFQNLRYSLLGRLARRAAVVTTPPRPSRLPPAASA